jgi:hypothetical protein
MPFRECIPRVQAWQRNLAGIDGDTAEDHAAEDIASVRRAERGTAVLDNCVPATNGGLGVTLTNEEREAIEQACDEGRWYPKDYHRIFSLRALMERLR